ncbi:sensor histidine kinase [Flexithrix dorotheae]|uniref:sensor histidine kinase n=1 Tax=Flexithrix dorotheae TaxID=70993 RepID=UPI000362CE1E|nr:HAMP domain-containing sensor histidine kinase [Flexithrix dorotheae]
MNKMKTGFQQKEKLETLGKLTAGLIHEITNPATIAQKSAELLKLQLVKLNELAPELGKYNISSQTLDNVFKYLGPGDEIEEGMPAISIAEKCQWEDEICEWLEENGFEDGYEMAVDLVDWGISEEDLEELKGLIPDNSIPTVLEWYSATIQSQKFTSDINEATHRINQLVGSVRYYSHMDNGDEKHPVDLKKSLENSILLLRHKWKLKNIKIHTCFSPNSNTIIGYESALNQVWTNLIDNAIDALDFDGFLKVKTESLENGIRISIIDSGAGIPKEIQPMVFNEFFTTKGFGKGTGLGLDIVNQIIQQHDGKVYVNSRPGHTEFIVELPFN